MDDQKNIPTQKELLYVDEKNANKALTEIVTRSPLTPETIRASKEGTITMDEYLDNVRGIEQRLTDTLANRIITAIKPLTQSKMDILEEELKGYIYLFTEVQKTFVGALLLRRMLIKLEKIDKEEEEKQLYSLMGKNNIPDKKKIRHIVKDIIKKI